MNIKGYDYISIQDGVCGNRPTITGTRLEPEFVVRFGKVEDVIEEFSLTREQIEECYWFVYGKQSRQFEKGRV